MKNGVLILVVSALLFSCKPSSSIKIKFEAFKAFEKICTVQEFSTPIDSYEVQNHELNYDSDSFFATAQKVFALLFIIFILFVIVVTPLVLFYQWISNFFDYYMNYRGKIAPNFGLTENQHTVFNQNLLVLSTKENSDKTNLTTDVQQNYTELSQNFSKLQKSRIIHWSNYRKAYSNMIGFGFGIFAWFISTYLYIFQNFDDTSQRFNDYFRFPFKVIQNLPKLIEPTTNKISSEIWIQMLMIVGISLAVYISGWIIGNFLAVKKCKRPLVISTFVTSNAQ